MKRLLTCLVPWMAMTAAASGELPRPAEVAFTHYGPAAAWRIGDECFVSPSVLANWGWTCTFVQSEATIQAEGRTLRVTARTIDNRMAIPLLPALEQLGAGFAWVKNVDSLDVWGSVRSITARKGKLSLSTTLGGKPRITQLQSPNRIQIDFTGIRLDGKTVLDLEANARVAQFSPNTVRVTVMADKIPTLPGNLDQPTRAFDLTYADLTAAPINNPPTTGGTASGGTATGGTTTGGTTTTTTGGTTGPTIPVQSPLDPPNVGPLKIVLDTEKAARISLPLSKALTSPMKVTRPDPLTIELRFTGVKYIAPEIPIGSPISALIAREEGLETIVSLQLQRPMGTEISTTAMEIAIQLTKPNVGNGKLAGKIIVVDPGHGGKDTGAGAPDKSVYEKNLNLSIGKLLSKELAAQGATVIMTRNTDVFISLPERAEIANRNKADFFLSVHINSTARANSTSGTIIFYRGKVAASKLLAESISSETKKVTQLPALSVQSDTSRYDTGFAVLRRSKMTGVLVETGFINHFKDRARMQEMEFQTEFAKAIVKGLRVFLGDVKPQE